MKKERIKICPTCLESFTTYLSRQHYCSAMCRYKATRKLKEPEIKKCKGCGSEFKTSNNTKTYCSSRCWQKYYTQRKYKKNSQLMSKKPLHWEILNRDNFRCQYCGKNPTEDNVKLHIDHIQPRIKDGTDDFDNLVTACNQCNSAKGAKRLIHEKAFKERLIWKALQGNNA